MDSLGDRLRETRKERNLTIEQVVRETNISKHFIQAIEMEDFSNFPGETYIIGFIRNYAEFLGLKGDDFVQLYRNLIIQGQDLPLEELVTFSRKGPSNRILLFGGIFVGIVLLVFFVFLFIHLFSTPKEEAVIFNAKREGTIYEFNSSRQLVELEINDAVFLTEQGSGEDFSIMLDVIEEEKEMVWFQIKGNKTDGIQAVEAIVGEDRLVDLNQDGFDDIKLVVNAIKSGRKISVELDRAFVVTPRLLLKDSLFTDDFYKENKMERADVILLNAMELVSIDCEIQSPGKTIISYRLDGKSMEEFNLGPFGAESPLKLAMQRGGVFWISDGYGLVIKVNGQELVLPVQKDPAIAFVLCWKQLPSDGGYELGLYLLDQENEDE